VPSVFAQSGGFVYSQFLDDSVAVSDSSVIQLLGDFVLSSEVFFEVGGTYAQWTYTAGSATSSPSFTIASSSQLSCVGQVSCPGGFIGEFNSSVSVPSGSGTSVLSGVAATSFTLTPGQWYIFILPDSMSGSGASVRASAYSRLFGFITAGDSIGVSIDPTLYVGAVASTTAQEYCETSFATSSSTGWLDELGASFAKGLCVVGVSLFMPSSASLTSFSNTLDSFENRAPFAYAFDVRDIYQNYVATTSQSFPSLSLDLSSASSSATTAFLGGSSIELLSSEKIEQFAGSSVLGLFRSLIGVALWLLSLSFIYRQVSSVWSVKVS